MPSSLPPSYTDAGRTALLVYDMQRGIAKQIADSERVRRGDIKTAIDTARQASHAGRIFEAHITVTRMAGKHTAANRDGVAASATA